MDLNEFSSIVFGNRNIDISPEKMQRVRRSYEFLNDFADKKLIYGINTGFGPMAQYRIDKNDLKQVQINLIRSHCTGTGDILSPKEVRGVMTVRLNTFVQGYSGVHTDVIEILQKFINHAAQHHLPLRAPTSSGLRPLRRYLVILFHIRVAFIFC